ncbi:hypothetical protein [Marisediminicola senii]|uniref:hypothetical protein n=1 Tax=Marisediminicola senii TaxID=2711233 RepID=UPI0013EBF62B|nr:hypothetical protein [Marisediminicola senii]
MTETRHRAEVRIAPKRALLWNALLSLVFVSVPLFVALYMLSVPEGTWPAVLVVHVVSHVTAIAVLLGFWGTRIEVRDDRIVARTALLPTRTVMTADVASIVQVETYRLTETDTATILLLRDARGTLLMNMRGHVWETADMRTVSDAVDLPLEIVPEPITTKEFRELYPGSSFWFEHRPALAIVSVAAIAVVSVTALLQLIRLAGIPIT